MGNNQSEDNNQARPSGQKIILKLRYRDIILHYSFKMKLIIADISIFPDHLEGLRLWDVDIVLSRFIILENQRFKNQEVMVFKAGVGIAGITLSKWGGCKSITMCDTKPEVVSNITRNCQRNEVHDAYAVLINLADFASYKRSYDRVLCTDLFGQGFAPQVILNIWRKLLKVGGEAIMIVPDKKDESKKLLELVDRQEFKINNLVLTAEEYQASPLFNKLDAESEFPLLGKSTFYAICLKKLKDFQTQSESSKSTREIVTNQTAANQLPSLQTRQQPKVSKPVILQREQQRKQNLVKPQMHSQKHQQKQPQKPIIQEINRKIEQEQLPKQQHNQAPKIKQAQQSQISHKEPLKEQQPQQDSSQPAQPEQRGPSNQGYVQEQQEAAKQEMQNQPAAEEAPRQQDSKDLEQS